MSGCHNPNFKTIEDCGCICHKPWGSTIAPCCACNCNKITPAKSIELCEHGKPVKFGCTVCYVERYNYESLLERLDKLEKALEAQSKFNKDQMHLNEIINKKIDKLMSIKTNLNMMSLDTKKPYKCPVCEGIPVKDNMRTQIMGYGKPWDVCQTCEGKGIVWG